MSRSFPSRLLSDEMAMSSLNFSMSFIPKFTICYTLAGWGRARKVNIAKHAFVIRGQFRKNFQLRNKVISAASDDKIQSVSITMSWTVNMLLKTSRIEQIKEFPCLSVCGIIYMKIEIASQNELVGCSDKFFKKFREVGKNCGVERLFFFVALGR